MRKRLFLILGCPSVFTRCREDGCLASIRASEVKESLSVVRECIRKCADWDALELRFQSLEQRAIESGTHLRGCYRTVFGMNIVCKEG